MSATSETKDRVRQRCCYNLIMLSALVGSVTCRRAFTKVTSTGRYPILAHGGQLFHTSPVNLQSSEILSRPVQYHPGGLPRILPLVSWREAKSNISLHYDGASKKQQQVDNLRKRYYKGDTRDGLRHGQGTQVDLWSTYTGGFVSGRKVGYGKEAYLDGSCYRGLWLGGQYYGEGKITYADGSTLEGEFMNGCIHNGHGKIVVCISKPVTIPAKSARPNKPARDGYTTAVWSTYEGAVVDGEIHGQGVLTYATGEVLRGEFRQGKIHNGAGFLKSSANTNYYIGQWENGNMHGECTVFIDGVKYVGGLREGWRHGQGEVTYANGDTLRGEFAEGRFINGVGTLQYPEDGGTSTGTWVNGQVQGRATLKRKDWGTYVGEVKDGSKHGQGHLTYDSGETLEGEFRNGEIYNGHGTWKKIDSPDYYTGTWVDGVMHGHAETFRDGWKYVGQLVRGVRSGPGELTFPSGVVLRGEFRDHRIHKGEGAKPGASHSLVWEDGVCTSNESSGGGQGWTAEELHAVQTGTGAGEVMKINGDGGHLPKPSSSSSTGASTSETEKKATPSAKKSSKIKSDWYVYVGDVVKERQHGQGTITYRTGEVLTGEFREGKIWNGQGVHKYRHSTDFMSGTWVEGKLQGQSHTSRYGNIYVGNMVNGKFDGPGELSYQSGGALKGEFKNGRIWNGEGTYKYAASEDFTSGTFVDGKLQGRGVTMFKSKKYEGELVDGFRHGQGVVTYPTGETLKGEFRKGKIWNGQGTFILPSSTDSMSGTWVDGKLHGPGVTVTSGRRYEGHLVEGDWHGQGVLTYETGETLRGEFVKGKIFNGHGTMLRKSGEPPLTGTWVNGEFTAAQVEDANV